MTTPRDVLSRSCPNCGARLDPAQTGQTLLCHYCGQSFQAPEANAPPAPRVIVIGPGMRMPAAPARRAVGRAVFSSMVSLIAVGVVAFLSIRARAPAFVPTLTNLSTELGPLAAATTTRSTFIWDSVAGPPMPATVGGADGFVGRVRTRGDDTLWMVAFDSAKLSQLWKVGPFGTYSEGYLSTVATVVGRDLVVTDYHANLHVYDLASGHEARTIKLTDRAKGMCASPDGRARVWLEMSDDKNVMIDADAGGATLAPRPAWCPNAWATSNDCRGWLKRGPPTLGCKGGQSAPKVGGFEAENAIEEGDLAVALGKRHPGTATPIAVGYDPKTRAVRWQQPIASGDQAGVAESTTTSIMDVLAGGRFVAPYDLVSKGWHVTAFDARSGQRVWDVPLQPLIGVDQPEALSMSEARLYVVRTSSMEAYDAKTGALVGTVGN